jgi:hypothetical protein
VARATSCSSLSLRSRLSRSALVALQAAQQRLLIDVGEVHCGLNVACCRHVSPLSMGADLPLQPTCGILTKRPDREL